MDTIELNRNADFEWAVHLNRITLNFIGIWPSAHENVHKKFLSNARAAFFFISIALTFIIPLIHSLVKIWGDLVLMIDNLQFTIPLLMVIIKGVTLWWKKTDLLIVINMIADDWIKVKTERERCIMIKHAQNARILTIIGYCIMFSGVIFLVIFNCFGKSVYISTNVTNATKILPYPTQYIYDKDQSPYFEFTYVAQILMALISAASYSAADNLLGLLIFHLCGQLESLKEKLIHINQFDSYDEGVSFIVKEHTRLIKCFHIIESIFTLFLLGLFIYFGIAFALYGFRIVAILTEERKMSTTRVVFLMSALINIAGHTCLFCAVGDMLTGKCEAIHSAACEHEWYEAKPQEARNMLLILIRASKPLYLTAGKIFPVTLPMFCNLIKTSAGYVSVLIAMKN